jgi:tRNA pseudouridine-54 N-methylase
MPPSVQPHIRRRRQPTSKELDLLLLAGCSCLLTVLVHPVADALHSAATARAASPIVAQTHQPAQNQANRIHVTLPPERDKLKREDEEA